jgi:hypothetical protein
MRKWPACVMFVMLMSWVIVGLAVGGPTPGPATSPSELSQLVARRPAPDLSLLVHRVAPDRKSDDLHEAFLDILKIRDNADARAVGVLEQIVERARGTTRIHGFAAAQALFAIGTPEAHKALAAHLLLPDGSSRLAMDYAFHWEMAPAQRDALFKQYLLKNLSNDLEVTLQATTPDERKGRTFDFTMAVKNTTDHAYSVRDPGVYHGSMLVFRVADGGYVRSTLVAKYKAQPPTWMTLAPGETRKFAVSGQVESVASRTGHGKPADPPTGPMLAMPDVRAELTQAGKFEVVALFEQAPLTPEMAKIQRVKNAWSGRAVSKPVVIEVVE